MGEKRAATLKANIESTDILDIFNLEFRNFSSFFLLERSQGSQKSLF